MELMTWSRNTSRHGVQGWHITAQSAGLESYNGYGPWHENTLTGEKFQSLNYSLFFTHCKATQYWDRYEVVEFWPIPTDACETCMKEELLRALV
jgi:lysozyme family protein